MSTADGGSNVGSSVLLSEPVVIVSSKTGDAYPAANYMNTVPKESSSCNGMSPARKERSSDAKILYSSKAPTSILTKKTNSRTTDNSNTSGEHNINPSEILFMRSSCRNLTRIGREAEKETEQLRCELFRSKKKV